MTVLTVLAVSAVVAVSVVKTTPLNSTPPFFVILRNGQRYGAPARVKDAQEKVGIISPAPEIKNLLIGWRGHPCRASR